MLYYEGTSTKVDRNGIDAETAERRHGTSELESTGRSTEAQRTKGEANASVSS